jgi:hypothetical protein
VLLVVCALHTHSPFFLRMVFMMNEYISFKVRYDIARAFLEARGIQLHPTTTLHELEWTAYDLIFRSTLLPLVHSRHREQVCTSLRLFHTRYCYDNKAYADDANSLSLQEGTSTFARLMRTT